MTLEGFGNGHDQVKLIL